MEYVASVAPITVSCTEKCKHQTINRLRLNALVNLESFVTA